MNAGHIRLRRWGAALVAWLLVASAGYGQEETPAVPPAVPAVAEVTDYVIGPTDVLAIRVAGEAELTGNYTVRFDGMINFPYVGEITAAGVGLAEFNRALRDRLASYYQNPQVTVEVSAYDSCVLYVLGEVENPGVYKFNGRTTLLETVAVAGGYKRSAARSSTMVVRSFPDKPQVLRIDMEKVIDDGAITLNVPLAKGDVIVVPKTFIADLNLFLDDITPSLSSYLRANSLYKTDWTRP